MNVSILQLCVICFYVFTYRYLIELKIWSNIYDRGFIWQIVCTYLVHRRGEYFENSQQLQISVNTVDICKSLEQFKSIKISFSNWCLKF